ncbi:DNA binding domain-containing protein, excisionase family [Modicisalibacter ilicicola DSM 19980]|uniref:DNA binding domain-containing protein, excisionase family n=1 Tax=Modicisalibacter ilicicola DSM 19980 TaxID=1121942 RepID=A0A1M4XJS4_9GAMM|nr:helix-turn-helix transcriptional regulator [Halomonas ilicicola]SHE93907.1 DNA binding domain-containing protein, excisionase family [Halomonas ilicicola DSM 19980]
MSEAENPFLNVHQVAELLHLNEKKIYQLASDGALPATKITGKWLFPRRLVEQWILESCHHGVLADRLMITGSDDPLLAAMVMRLNQQHRGQAFYGYSVTGTQLGLELLSQGRADVCAIHWGRVEESELRHPALIRGHGGYRHWTMVRLFRRSQGLIIRGEDRHQPLQPQGLSGTSRRWVVRQEGAGSQRFLKEWLAGQQLRLDQLNCHAIAYSEREVASLIARHEADIGPGTLSAANEFGLGFIPVSEEAFDLVTPRNVYFRSLLRQLFDYLNSAAGLALAQSLGGYSLEESGKLLWRGDAVQHD